MPLASANRANWLARPMFTSRYVVSASLASSAASVLPRSHTPLGRAQVGPLVELEHLLVELDAARGALASSMPPTSLG